jgi:hypothetical protein
MAFAAFIDLLRPGTRDRAEAVFAEHRMPADHPPGLVTVATFLRRDTLVRVADVVDGTDPAVALAADAASAALDDEIRPYLVGLARSDPAGWRARAMRRVQQRIVGTVPGASMSALWYDVHAGCERQIEETLARVVPQQRPMLHGEQGHLTGALHGVAVFVRDSAMIRVVSYTGSLDDVARYMATRPGRPLIERRLARYLAEPGGTGSEAEFLRRFPARVMATMPGLSARR